MSGWTQQVVSGMTAGVAKVREDLITKVGGAGPDERGEKLSISDMRELTIGTSPSQHGGSATTNTSTANARALYPTYFGEYLETPQMAILVTSANGVYTSTLVYRISMPDPKTAYTSSVNKNAVFFRSADSIAVADAMEKLMARVNTEVVAKSKSHVRASRYYPA